MAAGKVGVMGALVASVCCVGPLVVAVAGLGALGLGRFFSHYHWWFSGAGLAILAVGYGLYFREKRRCASARCAMTNRRASLIALSVATLAVFAFLGVNLYGALGSQGEATTGLPASPIPAGQAQITIPVEGMTCLTCEIAVEKALTGLPGVKKAEASTQQNRVMVAYDPARVSVEALVKAINQAGYQAKLN